MAAKTLTRDDQRFLRQAAEKLKKGEKLTERESRAHTKAMAIQEASWREKIYRDIPQGDFAAMCGGTGKPKQTKQLQDMERQWGLPFARPSIDLHELFAELWVFLVEQGPAFKLLMESSDDGESSLGVSLVRARIRKLVADADAAELRNAHREGLVCERDHVHRVYEVMSSRILRASEHAQKKWGIEGFELFTELASGLGDDIRGLIDADRQAAVVADADDATDGHAGGSMADSAIVAETNSRHRGVRRSGDRNAAGRTKRR